MKTITITIKPNKEWLTRVKAWLKKNSPIHVEVKTEKED